VKGQLAVYVGSAVDLTHAVESKSEMKMPMQIVAIEELSHFALNVLFL